MTIQAAIETSIRNFRPVELRASMEDVQTADGFETYIRDDHGTAIAWGDIDGEGWQLTVIGDSHD